MAVTADVVQVRLEAQTRQYEQNLRRAEQTSTTAFGRIAAGAQRTNAAISSSLRGLAGAFVGAQALQGSVQLIDAATSITNSLRVAGLEGAALTEVYDQLFASAQRNAAPLQSLAQLYSRVATVQDELNVSSSELTTFTDNVAKALRVAGTDAQAASGALLQLSQGLGAGVIRAEEFNSILEGATPIAQAAAAGLREAGGSVARLRQLVVDGKVSSEAFFRAFEAGSSILDDRLAGAEATVSQSFVRLQNVLIDVAGRFNDGTDTAKLLAGGLDDLGVTISSVAEFANAAAGPIGEFIRLLGEAQGAAGGLGNEIAKLTGAGQGVGLNIARFINDRQIPGLNVGNFAADQVINQSFSLVGETPQDDDLAALLTGRETALSTGVGVVNQTFSLLGETPQDQELAALLLGKVDPAQRTITLEDYAAPTAPGAGSRATASAAERERQAVLDLIDTLEFERSLIGQTAREQEIANTVRQAGAAATAAQVERIRELAGATYDAQIAQDQLNVSAEQWASTIQDATRGFIDDLIAGKSAAEAFGNVLSRVADQFLTLGLNNLFGTGGFNLAGLFGGTSTRATGGPVYAGNPTLVGERGPEVFVPSGPGRIIPNSQVGGSSVTFAPVIDARGADVAAVARLEQSMQRLAADIVPAIRREIATTGKKGRTRG